MPDLFYLVSRWWKQMLVFILVSMAAAVSVLLVKPSKYLSVATALPASTYANDKASVFNKNIQILYSAMGTADDLDMIVGTGQLDTVYISMAQQFNLADHYHVKEQGDAAIRKAAHVLKENAKVMKSEYGELKVKIWDTDKTLAPQIANAITDRLRLIHQSIQNSDNISLVKSLREGREKIQESIDSTTAYLSKPLINEGQSNSYASRRTTLTDQLQEYERLITEYQLLVDNTPPVLIWVEKARISDSPDKPRRVQILVATFILSMLFALLVAIVIEKNKSRQR